MRSQSRPKSSVVFACRLRALIQRQANSVRFIPAWLLQRQGPQANPPAVIN